MVFRVLFQQTVTKKHAEVHFYPSQESKGKRGKGKTHTQVQRSDFRYSAKVKRLRQIGAEMV